MTIEEKIDNAKKLFYSLYQSHKKEDIRISSLVLEENGLGGNDFFDVVCSRLQVEGFLKDYYPKGHVGSLNAFESSSFVYPKDKQKVDKILNKNYEHMQFSPRELRYNPAAIAAVEKWEKEREEDMAEIANMPRYHKFIVNVEKLEDTIPPRGTIEDVVSCSCGKLQLNCKDGNLTFKGDKKPVNLNLPPNKYEFKILSNLLEANRVLSYDNLLQIIYNKTGRASKKDKDNIQALIGNLRMKLEIKDGSNKDIFIASNGYKIDC
jgi:DNA-binding response OmpR family regulator